VVRELVIPLAGQKGGLLRRSSGSGAMLRLRGPNLTFVHPGVLERELMVPGGLVDLVSIDRGANSGDHGRFPILHRMVNGKVIPFQQGIEGWLWTTVHGSSYPLLSDRPDEVPNVAMLFVKPLEEELVVEHFRPEWVKAVAERSPLGKPSILGLLARADKPSEAEKAFDEFGVLGELTDREVPPTHRKHLPDDKPANPTLAGGGDDPRAATSIAPPGMG
jgi:hypothetical protein